MMRLYRNIFSKKYGCVSNEFDTSQIAQKVIDHGKNCEIELVQQDLR